ncbi:hypothetical protein ACLOJK_027213 [Asimina triloba]
MISESRHPDLTMATTESPSNRAFTRVEERQQTKAIRIGGPPYQQHQPIGQLTMAIHQLQANPAANDPIHGTHLLHWQHIRSGPKHGRSKSGSRRRPWQSRQQRIHGTLTGT